MSLMDTVFGGGIEQIEKDREAKKQANIQAILNQRRKDGNYDALGAFGTQLGTKLGDKFSKKIFGDPEMDQAKADQLAVEQIRSQYEPSDPRFGYALSDLFRKRGDMKTSISLFNQAQKQEKQIEEEQNEEIQKEALSKLLINPARQDLISEYTKAGGDTKVLIDLLKEKNSDSKYKVVGNNIFDTETGEYILSPKKGAGAGAGANEEPKKLKPKKYIENIINPDGSKSVNSVEILLDEEGNYYDADKKPITNFSKRGYVAFDATTYKTMSADAQRQADLLDKNRTAMYKLHSITTNPAAANVLGPPVSKQGGTRLAERVFATGSQNEIVLKNINEFRIEGVLNYLKDLGGSDTERELKELQKAIPENTNDVNVWKDYQLNTVFNVFEKVLNKTEETRETAKKEVSAMLDDFDPSDLKLIKDGGLIKPKGYVDRLIKSGKYTPSLNTDNLGKNKTEQLDSLVSKYLSNTGN